MTPYIVPAGPLRHFAGQSHKAVPKRPDDVNVGCGGGKAVDDGCFHSRGQEC